MASPAVSKTTAQIMVHLATEVAHPCEAEVQSACPERASSELARPFVVANGCPHQSNCSRLKMIPNGQRWTAMDSVWGEYEISVNFRVFSFSPEIPGPSATAGFFVHLQ